MILVQLDLEKVYDCVNWSFILGLMLSGPKLETNFKMKKRVRSGRYVGKGERIIRIY